MSLWMWWVLAALLIAASAWLLVSARRSRARRLGYHSFKTRERFVGGRSRSGGR